MQTASFTNKLKVNYKYMKLPTGEVDVFIYNFKEEKETEESGIEYLYEFNHFRTKKITEDEIKANPLNYLNYSEKELSQEEKIEALQEEVKSLKEKIENLEENK